MKKTFPASQLIINEDGSIFHLHIRPEHLADKVILVGDQGRVNMVASFFDEGSIEMARAFPGVFRAVPESGRVVFVCKKNAVYQKT